MNYIIEKYNKNCLNRNLNIFIETILGIINL